MISSKLHLDHILRELEGAEHDTSIVSETEKVNLSISSQQVGPEL